MQSATGSPVYRYRFEDAPPVPGESRGAYHSAEIEFVFGTLDSKQLKWRPEDRRLSELMSSYWTGFAKSGNPSAGSLPVWPAFLKADHYQVMHLSSDPHAMPEPEANRQRYEFLDSLGWSQPQEK